MWGADFSEKNRAAGGEGRGAKILGEDFSGLAVLARQVGKRGVLRGGAAARICKRPPEGGRAAIQLERAMRFELTTLTLARLCSTPELRPHRLDKRSSIKAKRGLQEGKRVRGGNFLTGDCGGRLRD